MEKLIIGSRGSKLAIKYAEIAKKVFQYQNEDFVDTTLCKIGS